MFKPYPRALVRTEFRRFPAGFGLRSDQGHPGAPTPPAGAPVPPPAAPTPPADPDGQDPQATDGQPAEPKTYDEAYVKRLRDEAAANRVKRKEAEDAQAATLDTIAKALGLKTDEADPAQLAEQLTASQAEARQLKVERAIERAARGAEADEDLVTAVLAHGGQLASLDPAAEGFAEAVAELVASTVEANPRLKNTAPAPGPGRSGGDFGGGPGLPPASLDAQIAEAEKRRDYATVIQLKRQKAAQHT